MTTTNKKTETLVVSAPNMQRATFRIVGSAPYVQNRFSEKASAAMREKQEKGGQSQKDKKREAKDFKAAFLGAQYKSAKGWNGIPADAFRAAMISACRIVGFKMTLAKLSLFVLAEGYDATNGRPLIKISGKPRQVVHPVRLQTGVLDLRSRPMWDEGWSADVIVRWDADQFSLIDVTNLMTRVGTQVGIGEGRPDSRESAGMGWGLFDIAHVIAKASAKPAKVAA
jgi:hypothetical protein